jgi:spermidine synthase
MVKPRKDTRRQGRATRSGQLPEDFELREFQTPWSGLFFKAERVLHSGTSAFQKIEVVENRTYGRVLFLDGLVQTTDRDEFFYHEMLAHPALTTHPRPRSLLIVGGGDGGLLHQTLAYPLERVVLCEIDPEVIRISKAYFPWLRQSLGDRRVELVLADANTYVLGSGEQFDIILVDSSDPVGPSGVLHQQQFFERLKKILKPQGIVASQAGSLLLHLDSLGRRHAFLSRMFKIVRFYLGPAPTYPGGTWCYNYLSDRSDPLRIRRQPPPGLRYYNREIHEAAFSLPNLLKEKLS